jgi:diaminopimelate decarboxylase
LGGGFAAAGGADYLNFGGGFDSPYVYRPHPRELGRFHNPSEAESFRSRYAAGPRFSLRESAERAARAIAEEVGGSYRILFEPGRAVCARALSTVLGVRAVKRGHYPDAQVVLTDGATSFLGPLHRGVHPLERAGERPTFVYGALPHSGDWLFQNVKLPALEEGDRLRVLHTGAYFLPLEAKFGHELPSIYDARTGEKLR